MIQFLYIFIYLSLHVSFFIRKLLKNSRCRQDVKKHTPFVQWNTGKRISGILLPPAELDSPADIIKERRRQSVRRSMELLLTDWLTDWRLPAPQALQRWQATAGPAQPSQPKVLTRWLQDATVFHWVSSWLIVIPDTFVWFCFFFCFKSGLKITNPKEVI